jgi:hypothetical protein
MRTTVCVRRLVKIMVDRQTASATTHELSRVLKYGTKTTSSYEVSTNYLVPTQ